MGKRTAAPAVAGTPEKQEAPVYRYRFQQSGAEWAVDEGGQLRVLGHHTLAPGTRVSLARLGFPSRRGEVVTLLPGIGPTPPVVAVVRFEFQYPVRNEFNRPTGQYKTGSCIRHIRADDLEVL